MKDLIEQAKDRLPLPQLMAAIGDADFAQKSTRSPFRNGDNDHCFGIFVNKTTGRWVWKDHVRGDHGDEIDYLEHRMGLSQEAAREEFFRLAGVTPRERSKNGTSKYKQAMNRPRPDPTPKDDDSGSVFDWDACVIAAKPYAETIAKWRGYSDEFVNWLIESKKIGWYQNGPAFPVESNGTIVGCHYTPSYSPDTKRKWRYSPGCKTSPLVIGDPKTADHLFLFESQWDLFAVADAFQVHTASSNIAMIATRGNGNGAMVREYLRPGILICAFPQNDPIDLRTGKSPAIEWMISVSAAATEKSNVCGDTIVVNMVPTPPQYSDANDWIRTLEHPEAVAEAVMLSKPARKSTISLRSIDEILKMDFDDSDNYFGDRVIAASQPLTILGPGGVGKSRLVLQLVFCMITGRKFLDIETHAQGKKWLILQTENSLRRLKHDINFMCKAMQFTPQELKEIDRCLFIHTIEKDEDTFLDLENPDELKQIAGAIEDTNPEFVVFDPLNTFTSLELNSDKDMKNLLTILSKTVKRGNPNRVPVIVHHALTGKLGAQKAVGYDKASYGRNSKALFAWTRSQINIAPRDPEDANLLLITCGKNNNGKLFPEMGIEFDEERGDYRIDPTFDPAEFRAGVGLKENPKKIVFPPERVADFCTSPIRKSHLVERIKDAAESSRSRAYELILAAENAGLITCDPTQKYNPIYSKKELL